MSASASFLCDAIESLREQKPLVHCITNYVTANDCANALLAIGAAPVMADDILEVAEITVQAHALVINIGTLNERTIDSMLLSSKTARERKTPIILDPVGAGATSLRTATARRLAFECSPTIIRGNASEIQALVRGSADTRGVDAGNGNTPLATLIAEAKELAGGTGAVVAITGKTDIATDGTAVWAVYNGDALMRGITGSGCMLSAICGGFAAVRTRTPLEAAVAALAAMGISGALARRGHEEEGTGSMRWRMIDELSRLDGELLHKEAQIEQLT